MPVRLTNRDQVRAAQEWLKYNRFKGNDGSDLVIDGIIGQNTRSATIRAQEHLKEIGLYNGPIDGIIGEETINAMNNYNDQKRSQLGILNYSTPVNNSSDVSTLEVPKVRFTSDFVKSLKGEDYNVSPEYLEEQERKQQEAQSFNEAQSLNNMPAPQYSFKYEAPTIEGTEIRNLVEKAKETIANENSASTSVTGTSDSPTASTSTKGASTVSKTPTHRYQGYKAGGLGTALKALFKPIKDSFTEFKKSATR